MNLGWPSSFFHPGFLLALFGHASPHVHEPLVPKTASWHTRTLVARVESIKLQRREGWHTRIMSSFHYQMWGELAPKVGSAAASRG